MASAPTPQLSIQLVTFSAEAPDSWQGLFDRAQAADEAGIDRVVVSDHVVFGEQLDAYGSPEIGGTAGGRQPTGPDGHWLEPLTVLTAISAQTTRVRLATGILLAALRRPSVLAKTTATLDVLSGGRLDLGVGVGWQREEYEAAGLEFGTRGRLLDHTLEVCQTLWRDQRASIDSPELTFERIHAMPKPVQPGGVPIWVSGTVNERVAARLARFGRGWIPWGPAAADVVTGIAQMRDLLHANGHDPADLQVTGNLSVVKAADGTADLPRTMAAVPALVAGGVTDVRLGVRVPTGLEPAREHLARVVAAFREATT